MNVVTCFVVMLAGMTAQPGSRVTELVPGTRQERPLAAGETHAYDVLASAGDLIHAVVEPQGIDVAVAVVGPDGVEILNSDLTTDPDVSETAMAVAGAGGHYQIRITPALPKVPAGRYVITLDPLRAASTEDNARAAAMRALEDGIRLARQSQASARPQAVTLLEQSRTQFRDVNDRVGETEATIGLAELQYRLQSPAALETARSAVALCRELRDDGRLAGVLSTLGLLHVRNGEPSEGREELLEAVRLTELLGHRGQEARARNSLGIAYGRTGDAEQAVEQFRRALEIARAMHWQDLHASVLGNLGIATKDLGDYEASAEYYAQALALARSMGDRNIEANTLNNLGNLHRILGDYKKALTSHEDALTLARQVGNREHEARALNTLGWTYYRLGDFQKALDHYQQALAIRRNLNDPPALASTLDGLGLASHELGDNDQALKYIEEGLRLRRSVAERYAEVESLAHLAQVKRDRGDLQAALNAIEVSVQLTDSLRGRLMSPDNRASFVAAEQERYDLYIGVLMQLEEKQPGGGFVSRALEAGERGRARVLLESLLEARMEIREGIDPALLASEKSYQRQLDEASTRLSRLLGSQADARQVDAARQALEKLSGEYKDLEARIRKESPRYAALTQPSALSVTQIQRELLDPDTVLLEFRLGEKESWLWYVDTASLGSFALPPRATIETAAREIYGLLTARQPRPGETPTARTRRIARADTKWATASRSLSLMLLGAAAARLGDAWRGKRLLIVAADVLEYLPFSALPDPLDHRHALVHGHEIVNIPSASVLAAIRQETEGRSEPAKSVAILADPVFEADDPRVGASVRGSRPKPAGNLGFTGDTPSRAPRLSRLPFSRQEARAIASLVPPADRLEATDFEASRALATSADLANYRLVHFATHGVLNSQRPELSGLVLSLVRPDGRAQDGFLRTRDIYNLHLPAEVVVLSACQTALGKEIRGEGLVGLTRGFMYAGARRVVASLWEVDDSATAELMRLFYRGMLRQRMRPAAALRFAQRQLAAQPRWASPFYWSPFVLQGEWK